MLCQVRIDKFDTKRESGVSPGQSRCCKFYTMLQTIKLSTHATGNIFREGSL